MRFFELQSAAMEAMRKSLDSMSGTFQMKWVNFEKFCKHRKGKFLDRKFCFNCLISPMYMSMTFFSFLYNMH